MGDQEKSSMQELVEAVQALSVRPDSTAPHLIEVNGSYIRPWGILGIEKWLDHEDAFLGAVVVYAENRVDVHNTTPFAVFQAVQTALGQADPAQALGKDNELDTLRADCHRLDTRCQQLEAELAQAVPSATSVRPPDAVVEGARAVDADGHASGRGLEGSDE